MPSILVYTDGSCSAKDRVGGYAWKIVGWDGEEYVSGGFEIDTTISRMELRGVIQGLRFAKAIYGKAVVLVYSDSQFVVKGFMDKTRNRNSNVDLWDELEEVAAEHELVVLEHVKGHAGHEDNEECDKVAGYFRRKALDDSTTTQS